MEIELAFTTTKSAQESVESIKAALAERSFSVLAYLHLNDKLAEKGLTLDSDIHILEVCNARKAKEAIDTNPLVAYFLPCKIIVCTVKGQTCSHEGCTLSVGKGRGRTEWSRHWMSFWH